MEYQNLWVIYHKIYLCRRTVRVIFNRKCVAGNWGFIPFTMVLVQKRTITRQEFKLIHFYLLLYLN